MRLASFVVAASIAAITPANAQDSVAEWGKACGLGLVPNEVSATFMTSSDQAFRDSYCGDWYKSHKQEVEGSGGLKILAVKVSADGSSTTEEVTHDKFCENKDYKSAVMTKWEVWSRVTSDDSRREFFRCVEHAAYQSGPNSPVVLGMMEETSQAVTASLRWDRNITSRQPVFDSVETMGLVCTLPFRSGSRISSNPQPISCRWREGATEGQIVVTIKGGGGAARSYERRLTRLGTVTLTLVHDEPYLKSTSKSYGPLLPTVDMDDKGCLPSDLTHFPGIVWGRILDQLRATTNVTDPACFDNKWGGFVYSFTITPTDTGGRLKPPYGIDCVIDDRLSCQWNEPHPIGVVSESESSVRLAKAYGSRSVKVKAWATEDIWDTRQAPRTLTWDLTYDGFTFGFSIQPLERVKAFAVEWADRSGGPITVGESTSRLKLVSQSPSPSTGPKSYTYQVSLGSDPAAVLKDIGSANARVLRER